MKTIRLQTENPKNPPLQIEVADSFFTRFCGLMLRSPLPEGHGLLLAPCKSIHTCFMRFAIDAVYIDRWYRIQKVVLHLRPWLSLSWCPRAWAVLELPSGMAEKYGLQAGDQLQAVSEIL